ncbi:hypothetical protein C8A05DRAFT_30476 [Staphylotrichum tortipilum]|uniref:C2H2-type domain-containing protein n=1 Tax=Staphylotrichum tortipilum TaxID=2831512 RepID=A0AAN6MTG7_9PEZI|nr:hypothetical protein C8A05DRAFT_30476 [Staphylotrichum longicolle]
MDPPASRKQAQPQTPTQLPRNGGGVGFPSPAQDYATINPKFVDDCTRMNFAIQQSIPEAVRRIVRDHWQKCLLGSEFHQAFVLNASIHHAPPAITQRAVRDFGSKMVAESKRDIISHFTTEALDEVADIIIAQASDAFLDRCLEKRLLTIEAKPLVNALAKAERLGYEPGDIIQDDQLERVIPHEAYPGAGAGANGRPAQQSQPPPPPASQPPRNPLQCMKCFRTFVHLPAFDYHTRFDVCSQIPPTANGFEHSCPHCGQGFTNVDQLQSHLDQRACGNFGMPHVYQGPGWKPKQTPIPVPSSQPPPANGFSATQPTPAPQSTPVQRSTPAYTTGSATTTPGSVGIAADPYGHLTEQQLQLMNEELRAAEQKYAPKFAEANLISDETARKARIEGLRNSFGTKQSMIRKKFGVRLRERRTKAEIMAEKERMGLQRAERDRAGSAPSYTSPALPRGRPPAATYTAGASSGWTAANTPRAPAAAATATPSREDHDAKRRRTDEAGAYHTPYKTLADETPTRKATVPEMSSQPTRVYEQSGARVEIHELTTASKAAAESGSATPTGSEPGSGGIRQGHSRVSSLGGGAGTVKQPVVVIDDQDSSSDDGDEDIPSTLPSHVRKSLASGSGGGSGGSLLRGG